MNVSIPKVPYPENPTVTTVIESMKNCLSRKNSFEPCKECAYYGHNVCNRDMMMDHAVSFLEMYKNSLDEKELKNSSDYFRKYREEKGEIAKRDERIHDLERQVKALKTNAYQVGYNEGADKVQSDWDDSRRWDNYIGM